ncbi:hypothetical protein [Paenibacillus mendelii]|uniref:Uncharacterized protein n=1 Tax=Paenibacillus mendelii TaxID=206163 RepID=A0ABV6JE95_9BACL|nr:hypothetical protein [Paenibacillus mendelii]MCQ6557093.1 hypothetical protein [Paenibacillus mendelii]
MTVKTGYPDNDPLFRHTPDRLEMECICKEYCLGKFVHNHGDLGGAYNVNLKIETTKGFYVIRIAFGLASDDRDYTY